MGCLWLRSNLDRPASLCSSSSWIGNEYSSLREGQRILPRPRGLYAKHEEKGNKKRRRLRRKQTPLCGICKGETKETAVCLVKTEMKPQFRKFRSW